MKHIILKITASALLLFALLTLFLSGSVIFDLFGIREKEGNYVLLVVWANFISSILYLVAAYSLFKMKKWSVWLLVGSVFILVAAFIGLKIHINDGGLYEAKTVNAMLFRIGLTVFIAVASYFLLQNKQLSKNETI
jgi:low affinity Fe/Cu permease